MYNEKREPYGDHPYRSLFLHIKSYITKASIQFFSLAQKGIFFTSRAKVFPSK